MRLSHTRAELTSQRGAAMMVMLVIMILGATAFLVSALGSSALKTARQETSASVLAQAKEALLGYAVSDSIRPGELPCPDSDDDGVLTMNVDFVGNSCTTLLGRLPWKTLGVPELRDASGEKLWYAVSDPFHANASATLNSDTAGTLSVSGNISNNNVVAIVFAPGANLPGQDRSTANINSYSHYLESVVTEFTAFKLSTTDDVQGGNYSYNDQMTLITHDNLFQTTEKAVGAYFKDSLLVNTYYTTWGALPFASALNATTGLLPISGNAQTPYWSSIQETGAGIATCTPRPSGCAGNACTYARCSSFTLLSVGDVVTITGTIENVGMGFWRLYDPTAGSSGTVTCTQEICARLASNSLYYPVSSIMDNVSITGSLDSNGRATITLTGTVTGSIPNRIQFSTGGLPDYSSTLLPNWFASNNWQDVMYYAVSPGYVPGGGNDCEPLGTLPHVKPYCLTLNGGNGGDDKRAIIIMTGSALAGKIHPSAAITDYMEGENATPADYIFENASRTSSFNDHAVSVAP